MQELKWPTEFAKQRRMCEDITSKSEQIPEGELIKFQQIFKKRKTTKSVQV